MLIYVPLLCPCPAESWAGAGAHQQISVPLYTELKIHISLSLGVALLLQTPSIKLLCVILTCTASCRRAQQGTYHILLVWIQCLS